MLHISHSNEGMVCASQPHTGLRSPRKKMPSIIASALVNLETNESLRQLSRNARDVLRYLIRLVDCRTPASPIFAFKRTIADHVGFSESSVYRALNELVNDNWIMRQSQRRKSRNGRLSGADIQLTKALCESLGLRGFSGNVLDDASALADRAHAADSLSTPSGQGRAGVATRPRVNLTDGYINTEQIQKIQSLQKHSSAPSVTVATQTTLAPRTKLPEEFSWLIEQKNLTLPQVFLLMREFSQRQQRLSDALVQTRHRVEQLPNTDVFPYLRALAKAPTDFAWLRKQREQADIAQQRVERVTAGLNERVHALHGSFLVTKSGAIHQVEATTNMARVWWQEPERGRLREGYTPIQADYLVALEAGHLQPVAAEQAQAIIARWTQSAEDYPGAVH